MPVRGGVGLEDAGGGQGPGDVTPAAGGAAAAGLVPTEMDGGHFVALSRPGELADRLEAYRADLGPGAGGRPRS